MEVQAVQTAVDNKKQTRSPIGARRTTSAEQSGRSGYLQASSKTADTAEISEEARAYFLAQSKGANCAVSGAEILPMEKIGENRYRIHFEDSAAVGRTVARGYLMLKGREVALPVETKKALVMTDKQAAKRREATFLARHLAHNAKVAKREADVFSRMFQKEAKAFETAMKVGRGKKVSDADLKEFMQNNPQLYALAMLLRQLDKRREDNEEAPAENIERVERVRRVQREEEDSAEEKEERKGYDTTLDIDLSGESPLVGNVQITEREVV